MSGESVLELVVMVAQYESTNNHCIAYFKKVENGELNSISITEKAIRLIIHIELSRTYKIRNFFERMRYYLKGGMTEKKRKRNLPLIVSLLQMAAIAKSGPKTPS